MADRRKVKKILLSAATVLLYIVLALLLIAVLLTVFSKKSEDGAVNVFGHQLRIVLTGSMEKSDMTDVSGFEIGSIPVNSLVVSENAPDFDEEGRAEWIEALKVGDVLVFRYDAGGRQQTITHRIIAIENASEGYKITLRGDNRSENEAVQVIYTADDASPNYILGKVVYTSLVLGNVLYILRQPIGIALAVIVPSAIIIVLQIIRIINVFYAEKRKKAEEREAEKSSEIELLKKRLADLEKENKSGKDALPAPEEALPQEENATKNDDTMSEEEGKDLSDEDTMPEAEAPKEPKQNRDPTGLAPAIESSKEVKP